MINTDWRSMKNGMPIPTEAGGYADQPSIVLARDGSWVCSSTTGKGGEGARGQYVNITRSLDRGRTWSEPIALEDTAWESAYSSLAVAPGGRIFCFYCYNLHGVDIREADLLRYDMGGAYCFRFSDDCGVTWSDRRVVPVRDFAIDREQTRKEWEGRPLRFFWNVSRIFFDGDVFYSPLIKYEYRVPEILYRSEGVLLRADGLADDPDTARWQTLPDGDAGLRTPPGGGLVAEEQSYVRLTDGSFFAVYRTTDGFPACTVSRDGGHTFRTPDRMRYADGRPMKHNRAANFIWPIGEGEYLYWFNNHGERSFPRRNPIWCSLATEADGPEGRELVFSEPEILLYHDSEQVMMSYPDLLWDDGWYVTETQKTEARIHPIDGGFLDALRAAARGTLRVDDAPVWTAGRDCPLPTLEFSRGSHAAGDDQRQLTGTGFTLVLEFGDARPGDILLSDMTRDGGIEVALDGEGYLAVRMGDAFAACSLAGSVPLADGKDHRVAVIADSRACVLYAVADGRMDDGGDLAVSGWRWMHRAMVTLPGGMPRTGGALKAARLYDRAMMTCEAMAIPPSDPGKETRP